MVRKVAKRPRTLRKPSNVRKSLPSLRNLRKSVSRTRGIISHLPTLRDNPEAVENWLITDKAYGT